MNTMKQAPFNVPNWAPSWLFPRDCSFYYEYECTYSKDFLFSKKSKADNGINIPTLASEITEWR